MKLSKKLALDAKDSASAAGRIGAARNAHEDHTQNACDEIYAALNTHRENCPACDGEGSGECPVGETLHEAWGLSETFRDSFLAERCREVES